MRLSIIKFPNLLETVQFNRVWAMSCKATILLLKGMNTQWSQQPIGLVDVTRVRLDTKWNCRWNSHVVCYGLSIFWSIVRDRQETLPWSVTGAITRLRSNLRYKTHFECFNREIQTHDAIIKASGIQRSLVFERLDESLELVLEVVAFKAIIFIA